VPPTQVGSVALRVREELERRASPERLAGAERFFPGQSFRGYGVPAPEVREIARRVYRQIKSWPAVDRDRLCTRLWEGGSYEEGAVVCHLYRRFAKTCGAREFRLFTRWIGRYVHNWAHTDGLAGWLLGASIANVPELAAKLEGWVRSRNRWKRRAAAVALVYPARRGELTREILRIAERLLGDSDEMVQKGLGWLLKETYPKRPAAVMRFLMPRRGRTTRLVLRYAAEKMTAQDRARLLAR
jgi:3-methyladenine DNA glycosylase AlkD